MAHKKVAKIIATAIVVNNLSSRVVLGKEVNLIDRYITYINTTKDNRTASKEPNLLILEIICSAALLCTTMINNFLTFHIPDNA